MIYDLIIIGAGPSGITASVYAARKQMSFLVITKDIGGQTVLSSDIENYTGYQFITGPELVAKFEEHMRHYQVTVNENEEVTQLAKHNQTISVKTQKGAYESRAVIIASGKRSRELNVPGEKEFKNHGLSYCATCDAPLFAGKTVAVIGGGNSALDAALQLIKIAKSIYVINIAPQLTGDAIMRQKVESAKNATILNNAKLTAITGNRQVSAIKLSQNGRDMELAVEGVFVEIGLIPNSEFASGIEKNQYGEIKVDAANQTNVEGIFAAGDVTDVPEKQIIVAAGEGSKAALSIFKYLAQRNF